MRSGAAEDFERLAFVLDVASRGPDAIEAAQKAVALESTPARTALVARLADAASRTAGQGARREGTSDVGGELARVVPPTAAETARAMQTSDPAQTWPLVDQPTPHPAPMEGPPPDPDALLNEAAELLEAGNVEGAAEKMLTAVRVHRAAGRLDAALDICLQLLSIVPGDPHVHLAIANLQLDHGWTTLAKEKIELLVRLTALTGDTQAEADVHGLAAERLRDEPATAPAGR
jgi:hypothetical protein